MPNVLGNIHDTPCHMPGMLDCGQLTPDINSNGMLTKTMSSITFSRYLTIHDTSMPKKIQAMT